MKKKVYANGLASNQDLKDEIGYDHVGVIVVVFWLMIFSNTWWGVILNRWINWDILYEISLIMSSFFSEFCLTFPAQYNSFSYRLFCHLNEFMKTVFISKYPDNRVLSSENCSHVSNSDFRPKKIDLFWIYRLLLFIHPSTASIPRLPRTNLSRPVEHCSEQKGGKSQHYTRSIDCETRLPSTRMIWLKAIIAKFRTPSQKWHGKPSQTFVGLT